MLSLVIHTVYEGSKYCRFFPPKKQFIVQFIYWCIFNSGSNTNHLNDVESLIFVGVGGNFHRLSFFKLDREKFRGFTCMLNRLNNTVYYNSSLERGEGGVTHENRATPILMIPQSLPRKSILGLITYGGQ